MQAVFEKIRPRLFYQFVIFPRCQAVYGYIDNREGQDGSGRSPHKEPYICNLNGNQEPAHHIKGSRHMEDGRDQRQEEHDQNLAARLMPTFCIM